jgi:membrane protein implicated in regulation of membrane protease activity
MVWWQWVVVGALLLGSEMVVVDAGFYLVFIGAAALLMGAIGFVDLVPSLSIQWLLFAALSIITLVFFRGRIYARVRGNSPVIGDGVVGEIAVACEDIAPGGQGTVQFRGSDWTARNVGERPIAAESRSRVEGMSGATVSVRASD